MKPMDVWCASCKAEPGTPCKTRLGEVLHFEHFLRTCYAADKTPKAQPAPAKLGPARLAHAVAKEAASRGVSIVYLGERGAPAEPDRRGVDYWVWHVCGRGSVLIEFQGWQTDFAPREALLLLDAITVLPADAASRGAVERLLPQRRS